MKPDEDPPTDDVDGGDVQPEPEPDFWSDWFPDTLLPGYETRTFTMPGAPREPDEGDAPLRASLVRRATPRQARAVLYIHGWNDYFFQTHVADAWDDLGYDFYALDLRRYGRSLAPHQLPGYIDDLRQYDREIDAAVSQIAIEHRQLVLAGHSTGGLIACLWADRHPGELIGLHLNSPWLDLQGSAWARTVAPAIIRTVAGRVATWPIPAAEVTTYGRTLHADLDGEWDFDLDLKRIGGAPVRPGWLRAILEGHRQVAEGLAIDVPVLMVISDRSDFRRGFDESMATADVVLDVDRLAARAHLLGWHVTLVRLAGALHDISLSRPSVRERFFDETRRWDLAYLRTIAGPGTR